MEEILHINKLSKHFSGFKAVDQLSLSIKKGSVFGLLGPNGSGKSTTLGMLLGVIKPSGGDFKWFPRNPHSNPNLKIGAILDGPSFYDFLSGRQNLAICALIKKVPERKIDEVLQQVNLKERQHEKFKNYSLGMKQRLAIANALLADPEVLILDEPTNGLDPEGIADIRSLIIAISQSGKTILLASHLLDEVQKVCTDYGVLKKGRIIHSGPIGETQKHYNTLMLNCNELSILQSICEESDFCQNISFSPNGLLSVQVDDKLSVHDFHTYLIGRGITLTHLQEVSYQLEEEFIRLLKEQ
ncbi:MAG: ATP-binding cassette domain-containing protein [Cyclobacteriaceae bacterium]|nr:ATP-binding cassette domain-containing protein [Cyclobacteriaceae bacterium]